ncbi:hypothetical protein OSB04_003272 [Centaurea solstitialis]|uniref:Kinesin motor domain-containing protein n=1 Tax=Centaurea solstitialis TaxID=347529 RepID=A0AA38WVM7_9ASTR|nr:hypothetical protein OSB04_003272 [Centaurea solstitialis]
MDTRQVCKKRRFLLRCGLGLLNEKEIAKGDASDWECINSTTIVFKNNLSERSMYPNAYSFDRVYGCDSSTKEVYMRESKELLFLFLMALTTSSGKTYTMSGITEFAITDIYDYITKHTEREFVLKFSAIEIYNECVRDLLGTDATPLRLLDDPSGFYFQKGTVVEKLTEAPLRDSTHLRELIYVCEAERQIGETALNEMSSRSHQILRLNFVDLAGSERASQTMAAGARLKEGCHINRSLLTLGTVIRKLSKGGNGHVPYRNSKLTRILQNSLGGNAKTAILCTICPAHSHLEQSRNTLLFASCAKHVNTNAQVNVVMSDKALVKQLQQELARLEHELRMCPASSNGSTSIIQDMKLQIEKMGKEIEDLTQQRDLLHSRLEHLIRVTGIDQRDPIELSEMGSGDGYPHRFDASLKTRHLTEMEGTQTLDENQHFVDENSPLNISQETTRNTKDMFNEDQHIDNMSSIDNNIKADSSKKDQLIEKTSRKDNSIETNTKESYNEGQYIMQTSSVDDDDDITINPQGKDDQSTIQKTTNAPINTTMNPDSKEDQHIEKTLSIDENIKANTEGNEKEDQNNPKDEEVTENPEGSEKEDENIQINSSIDEKDTVNPEGNEKEYQNFEKTLSIDEKEDQNIQRTSNKDGNINKNLEDNYKEDEGIEETSSIDNKITAEEAHLNGSSDSRKKKTVNIQTTVNHTKPQHEEASPCSTDTDNLSDPENIIMARSKSYSVLAVDPMSSILPPPEKEIMIINESDQDFSSTQEGNSKQIITKSKSQPELAAKTRQLPPTGVDEKEMEHNMKLLVEDDVSDHFSTPKTPNALSAFNFPEGASIEEMVKESEAKRKELVAPNEDWSTIFEKQRREIIRLWDACNTPLIHRTYFFLLFKGDQSDSVYMEVELRRLSFLVKTPSSVTSERALSRERLMLSKKLLKTFTAMQRDALFQKWGIPLNSKHRRVQLSRLVWTKTNDMDHIKDSAEIVAKLVGIVELNETPKNCLG